MATETPKYEVLRSEEPFELRRYAGYLTANVHVDASSHSQAVNAGFNALADFIFGNNTSSSKIAMTAPVGAGEDTSEKIAMTVPVSATEEVDPECVGMCSLAGPSGLAGGYNVSFTMPSKYTRETLPTPNNPRVKIETVPPYTAAVIRFSGYMNEDSRAESQDKLEQWIARQGMTLAGPPIAAQYDAPWKPWFARRNEIIIPVAQAVGVSPIGLE